MMHLYAGIHDDAPGGCYVEQFDVGRPVAREIVFPQQTWTDEWAYASHRKQEPSMQHGVLLVDVTASSSARRSLASQQSQSETETRLRGLREATRLSTRQRSRERRQLQSLSGQAVCDRDEARPVECTRLTHVVTQAKLRREQVRDLPHACYVRQHYDELLESASRRESILQTFRTQHQDRTELQTYSGQKL